MMLSDKCCHSSNAKQSNYPVSHSYGQESGLVNQKDAKRRIVR